MTRLGLAAFVSACLTFTQAVACEPDRVEFLTGDGAVGFQVEIADDAEEQARGLMFRQSLARDKGMLFVYDPPQRASFWMKNTFIPLDMIFIDDTGIVESIAARTTPFSLEALSSKAEVRAVLEINAGQAEELAIGPGTLVRHPAFQSATGENRCPA